MVLALTVIFFIVFRLAFNISDRRGRTQDIYAALNYDMPYFIDNSGRYVDVKSGKHVYIKDGKMYDMKDRFVRDIWAESNEKHITEERSKYSDIFPCKTVYDVQTPGKQRHMFVRINIPDDSCSEDDLRYKGSIYIPKMYRYYDIKTNKPLYKRKLPYTCPNDDESKRRYCKLKDRAEFYCGNDGVPIRYTDWYKNILYTYCEYSEEQEIKDVEFCKVCFEIGLKKLQAKLENEYKGDIEKFKYNNDLQSRIDSLYSIVESKYLWIKDDEIEGVK